MSHMAVRIVADWLAAANVGVNAIAALVPRDVGDAAPPAVTVYDETHNAFVAHGPIPREDTSISFPAVIVALQQGKFDGGIPVRYDAGGGATGMMIKGEVTLVVMLVLDNDEADDALQHAMYLLRAIRGSLLLLDQADDLRRERTGVRIQPSTSMPFGRPEVKPGDRRIAGAVLPTYPTWEAAPVLTSSV